MKTVSYIISLNSAYALHKSKGFFIYQTKFSKATSTRFIKII